MGRRKVIWGDPKQGGDFDGFSKGSGAGAGDQSDRDG